MGREPDVLVFFHVLDEFFEHDDPAAVSDDLGMHGQDK